MAPGWYQLGDLQYIAFLRSSILAEASFSGLPACTYWPMSHYARWLRCGWKYSWEPPIHEVCYLVYVIICISFIIVGQSTMQSSRRGADICATQAKRALTITGVAVGCSLGITHQKM